MTTYMEFQVVVKKTNSGPLQLFAKNAGMTTYLGPTIMPINTI
jgi:hypothetical protein